MSILEEKPIETGRQDGDRRQQQTDRLKLFSGRSHQELAQDIAGEIGIKRSPVELKTFANGETYVRLGESVRGQDVYIIQTGCPPVDRHLNELCLMAQAAKLASARSITAVMPWYPYSRQDKKSAPREPISAKYVADTLQVAGVDRVITVDLHAGQIQGFFDIPLDHMTALPLFVDHFQGQGLDDVERVVSVSPDAGRTKTAIEFARLLFEEGGQENGVAVMNKIRPKHESAAISHVIGDVVGRIAILGDDMIATGGTLIAASRALKEAGAEAVHIYATHGHFTGDAMDRLFEEDIDSIVVTDTVPVDESQHSDRLKVLRIAPVLAKAILGNYNGSSVPEEYKHSNHAG